MNTRDACRSGIDSAYGMRTDESLTRQRHSGDVQFLFLIFQRPMVLAALLSGLLFFSGCSTQPSAAEGPSSQVMHMNTAWLFTSSEGFDALCLINALTGDPFYTEHYFRSAMRFRRLLPPEVLSAIDRLYRNKQRYGIILSAFSSLMASTGPHETIEEVIAWLSSPNKVFRAYRSTPYSRWYHGPLFRLFLRADLVQVLQGLVQAGFPDYWQLEIEPRLRSRRAELEARAAGLNVVPVVEKLIGRPLESGTITVYLQGYTRPHAIRVSGISFITDVSYPDELIFRNAVHELFHPPVCWSDTDMQRLLRVLKRSPFIRGAYDEHDPVYGYNTWEGYVEENIVRFLEQIACEELGIPIPDASVRWVQEDGGMHVLSAVLYSLARDTGCGMSDRPITDFLKEQFLERGIAEEDLLRLYCDLTEGASADRGQ